MKLALANGHSSLVHKADHTGIPGPVIKDLSSLTSRSGMVIAIFTTRSSAAIAHLATGWHSIDETSLVVDLQHNHIVTSPAGEPPTFYTDWSILPDTGRH